MDILRLLIYIIAPWIPFLLRKRLYNFKVGPILFSSLIFLMPFCIPLLTDYSFSNPPIFSIAFILFLISLATLFWLLTNNRKLIIFATIVNVGTIILFWSINRQKSPYTNRVTEKPVTIKLKEQNGRFSDIEETTSILGNYKSYQARKKFLGGILVRKYDLQPINDNNNECLYKGYDYDRNKVFYWDKCSNNINEP